MRPRTGTSAAAALLLALVPPPAQAAAPERPAPALARTVCIRGVCFEAEVAVTAEERSRGLMHRDSLPPGRGMLFVFPAPGNHRFWMKNTLIELDIVFVGADGRVLSVAERAPPCRAEPCPLYGPEGEAAYALEIGGGLARRHGFSRGDAVEFR